MLIDHDDPFLPSPIPERRRRVFGRHHIMFPGCCPCPTGCTILNDKFNGGSLANFTQVSGTWTGSTANGGQIETASTNAILLANGVSFPASGGYIETNFTTFERARIIFGYVDQDNYFYVEFVTTGSMTRPVAYQLAAGVATQIPRRVVFDNSDANGTAGFLQKVYWEDELIVVHEIGNYQFNFYAPVVAGGAGIGTGAITGTVVCSEATFNRNVHSNKDCIDWGCLQACTDPELPSTIEATFTGEYWYYAPGCTDAGNLNGQTFAMDRIAVVDFPDIACFTGIANSRRACCYYYGPIPVCTSTGAGDCNGATIVAHLYMFIEKRVGATAYAIQFGAIVEGTGGVGACGYRSIWNLTTFTPAITSFCIGTEHTEAARFSGFIVDATCNPTMALSDYPLQDGTRELGTVTVTATA